MAHLKTISPEELIALAILVVFSFAEEFDADELNVLGNLIVDIGGIMMTIAAQRQLLDTTNQEQPDVQQQIKELQEQLKALQKQAGA